MAGEALREVIAFFGLNFDKGGFKDLDSKIGGLKDQVVGLARVFTTGLIANEFRKMITETAELGNATAVAADKIGIGTAALQELRYAGELSEVSADTLDRSLMQLGRHASEAAQGTGEAKTTFAQLGIALKDSHGQLRPTEQLLGDVADRMAKTASAGDRLRIAQDLFGREGVAMVTMLKDGRDGLQAMREEAQALGLVMSDKLIASSREYDDTMDRLHGVIRGVKNAITEDLLPGIIESTQGLVDFIRANRELLSGTVVAGARFLGQVFRTLRDVIVNVAQAAGALLGGMGGGFTTFVVFAAIITALNLALGSTAVTFLVILAAVDDLAALLRGEDSVFGRIADFLQQPISEDDIWLVRVLKTIANAVKEAAKYWAELSVAIENSGPSEGLKRFVGDFTGVSPNAGAVAPSVASRAVPVDMDALAGQQGFFERIARSAAGMVMGPPVQQYVTVNGAPGQDPKAIGDAVVKASAEQLKTVVRETHRRMVPRAQK